MEPLFDTFERTRTTKSEYDESMYNFINESAWDFVEYYRTVINSWYQYFPADKNFIKQFKSCDNRQHQSAFFELFMFSLFRNTGYQVEYHSPVGKRKIDLKVSACNDSGIYIDCTLSGEPNIDHSIQKIEEGIKKAIEAIDSPCYYVIVYIASGRKNYPKVSKLFEEISYRLKKLEDGTENPQNFTWENNGWYISIRFQKKSSLSDTTIGSYLSSQGGGFIDGPSYDILANTLNS